MEAKKPRFFATAAHFRRWLEQHHASADELWVGFYKKGTGKPSISRSESVDEALCFGWIDGLGKSLGPKRYVVRFTPRRPGSIWSKVNLGRVKVLRDEGRVHPAGLRVYEARDPKKAVYSHQRQDAPVPLAPELQRVFRATPKAFRFFEAQPPGYRRLVIRWIMEAKRDATRERRLQMAIKESAAERRIDFMAPRTLRSSG